MGDSIFKFADKFGYESPFGNWLVQNPTISIDELGAFLIVENNVEVIKIEFSARSNIELKNVLVVLTTRESEALRIKGVEMRINVSLNGLWENIFVISIPRSVYESHLKQTDPLWFFLELHHEGSVYTSLDFDLMWSVELSGDRIYNSDSHDNSLSGSTAKLTKDERLELIRLTGNKIDKAYTSFVIAAERVARIVRDTIKAEIEFAYFLAEIALGLLMPGAGKLLKSLTSSIPSHASNSRFLEVFKQLDEKKTTELLLSGIKIGQKMLVSSYAELSKIDKIETFIDKLSQDTLDAFEELDENLYYLSDEEITCLFLSFDSDIVNTSAYQEIISKTVQRFEKQILTIGNTKDTISTAPQGTSNYTTGVIWMEYKPKKIVLANLTLINKVALTGGGLQETIFIFNSFIDEDLGVLAEKIGNAVQPNGVIMITNSGIKTLQDDNLLVNYPTNVPTGKFIKNTN